MSFYSSRLLTTSSVPPRDAANFWVDLICATFVQLSAKESSGVGFHGEINWEKLGDLEFSTVTASGQDVFRTKTNIAASSAEYLLFSIQRRGEGRVLQDGRTAHLRPGEMALYDSGRPYSLHFADSFQQLVVQIPKTVIGIEDTRKITARSHQRGTPGAVAAQLLVAVNEQLPHGGASLEPLREHILGTLGASTARPNEESSNTTPDPSLRSLAVEHMRRDYADSQWTVARLAQQIHASERTLHRIFPKEGPATVMRKIRIDQAKRLLQLNPHMPLAAVAQRCGFESESGFIRAFRAATDVTPQTYRESSWDKRSTMPD